MRLLGRPWGPPGRALCCSRFVRFSLDSFSHSEWLPWRRGKFFPMEQDASYKIKKMTLHFGAVLLKSVFAQGWPGLGWAALNWAELGLALQGFQGSSGAARGGEGGSEKPRESQGDHRSSSEMSGASFRKIRFFGPGRRLAASEALKIAQIGSLARIPGHPLVGGLSDY